VVKILSNSSDPVRRRGNVTLVQISGQARRSVRRLMKRDPNTNQGTPDNWLLVGQNGVEGRSGASPVRSILGKAKVASPGAGVNRIRNRGTNTNLRKR
jgi:hypothetical protein